ncbi:MAG: hypothetical protein RL648_1401 [Verrucomicrobiota bacterium]|jgi:phosphatidylglycerophosphatase A
MQPLFTRWLRLLLARVPDKPIVMASTLGQLGYWGRAPGTNGSVVGILLYTVFFFQLNWVGQLALLALLVGLAVIICGEAERRLQKRDPGEVILDEVVAIPLCFIGLEPLMGQTGQVWLYMLAGFALFRLFDILKPLGINRLQDAPGGWGVVLDDLGAAVATNVVLRLGVMALQFGGWIA